MRKDLVTPKKICPICKRKALRKYKNIWGAMYCPYLRCPTRRQVFGSYQELRKFEW